MNRTLRVIACIALTGCHTYQLGSLVNVQPKNQVRVTTRDGRRVELYDVTVANDTLRGQSRKQQPIWRLGRDNSVAVAATDVTKVEVRRLHAARTALAIIGVPVLMFGVAVGILAAICGNKGCYFGD